MILDHCVSLLCTGKSVVRQEQYTSDLQVYFKLQSGVTAKRLDSLRTALLMIETIKVTQKELSQEEQYARFNNFIDYIFTKFRKPTAMALVKYAIADRKLVIKKLAESSSWSKISGVFKPVLLDDSKDPVELATFKRFERVYKKVKSLKEMSEAMNDFAKGELVHA